MNPIALVADIERMDDRNVWFRASIDETEPETVITKITRERWDKWGRPTRVPIVLFDVPETES